jgi:hypothetical protein
LKGIFLKNPYLKITLKEQYGQVKSQVAEVKNIAKKRRQARKYSPYLAIIYSKTIT